MDIDIIHTKEIIKVKETEKYAAFIIPYVPK